MSIIPNLFSEDEIANCFNVSLRVVREHARSKGIGRKIGRKRWFTETEATTGLWEGGVTCSGSSNGGARHTGISGGRSTGELSTRLQKRETKRMLADLRRSSKSSSPNQPAKNVTQLRSKKPLLST
jgi:hypothetical protein